ncbi:MAG: hypothetical protein NTX25_04300, partial [Proteobacteria bacterium]|nr:hypothetical protein [Pseudomonadota bacterium]
SNYLATCFVLAAHLEPLFTIYEPEFCCMIGHKFLNGERSLQRMLKELPVKFVKVLNADVFLNANDDKAFKTAVSRLTKGLGES